MSASKVADIKSGLNNVAICVSNKVQAVCDLAISDVVMIHTYSGGIKDIIIRIFINYAVAIFSFFGLSDKSARSKHIVQDILLEKN